jgi:hypothetical protein
MERRISPTAGGSLRAMDVISTHLDWYIDIGVIENLITDEEELAMMFFLYFWGGDNTPGLCECPNCNPSCKTFLRGQPS